MTDRDATDDFQPRKFSSRIEVQVILMMALILGLPAFLTLRTIDYHAGALPLSDPRSSPGGYTWSLLLFAVPCVAMALWHFSRAGHRIQWKAFAGAALAMALIGTFLDIAFGYHFFSFPNEAATLGIRIRAWDWSRMGWELDYLPVEEFGFYILGGCFMVGAYVWADLNWLYDYDPDRHVRARTAPRLVGWNWPLLCIWLAAFGAGWGVKIAMDGGGFPGYLAFLTALGFIPIVVLWRVHEFVNWHAFAFASSALLTISLLWEATLAVPYGWWVYKPEMMMGIFVTAWWNLPVEAVLLWLVGSWDAIMLYEALRRVVNRMEHDRWTVRQSIFGVEGGGRGVEVDLPRSDSGPPDKR